MKVAIYARVSTSEQTTDNQILRLIEYCKSKSWNYDVFDEVMSSRKTRPVKQALLSKLRAKEYDAVIVFKLDRWARSSSELILNTKEILDKGVGFISYSDNIDFTTASGKLHFQILSAFAEFERSLISERTKEGLRRAKQQGASLGRPKGSKDTKKRRKSGYILREANKRKDNDEKNGIHKSINEYLN